MIAIMLVMCLGADEPPPDPKPEPTPREKSGDKPDLIIRNVFLRQYDANDDGRLSPRELPKKLAKRFAESDMDGDGYLSGREVLLARNRIGREARKADGLDLDSAGILVERGRSDRGEKIKEILVTILKKTDLNNDGTVEHEELKAIIQLAKERPDVILAELPVVGEFFRPKATVPDTAPPDTLPPDKTIPDKTVPDTKTPPAKPEPSVGPDGLPTTKKILSGLDANSNGMIDKDEAVDMLKDRFAIIDRDRNGGLDAAELERALALARLLGIKPKLHPRSYRRSPTPMATPKQPPK